MRRNRDAPGDDPGMAANVRRTRKPLGPRGPGRHEKAPPDYQASFSTRLVIEPHPDRETVDGSRTISLRNDSPRSRNTISGFLPVSRRHVTLFDIELFRGVPCLSRALARICHKPKKPGSVQGGRRAGSKQPLGWLLGDKGNHPGHSPDKLGCSTIQTWCNQQLGFQETFSRRSVEQDSISVRLPNGRKLHSSRAVKAKVHSAGTASPTEYSFRHLERIELQFIVFAQGLVHEISKGI